jgi:hypothetical protein
MAQMTPKMSFTTIVRMPVPVYSGPQSERNLPALLGRHPDQPLQLEQTMKVMAIGTLKPLTPEQQHTYMPKEVPATLQLYLDGKKWSNSGYGTR